MTDQAGQQATQADGVSRRQFLRFTGLGLAAGFAAMLIGSRVTGGKKGAPKVHVTGDSMFRPRDSSTPRS